MKRPRRTDALRAGLVTALLAGVACAPPAPPALDGQPHPQAGVRLRGEVRGPLPGLGPGVELDLWMRADRVLRADLRTEGEEGPRHEVLLWTPEVAWLYDRRRLRAAELGPEPGQIEALGGLFRVEELWWVLLGRGDARWLPEASWEAVDGEKRGSAPQKGYRRPVGPRSAWGEVVWRDPERNVHHLRAERFDWEETALGPLPTRLEWEGSDLEGRATLRWRVENHAALGDSVFDPLWEPEGL